MQYSVKRVSLLAVFIIFLMAFFAPVSSLAAQNADSSISSGVVQTSVGGTSAADTNENSDTANSDTAASETESVSRVYDNAGLFTSDETAALNADIQKTASEYGMGIAVVTTDDAQGKSAQTYAEDSYNELLGGQYDDGVLFLIDMDNREIYLTAAGRAQEYFSDSMTNTVLDEALKSMQSDGAYACARTFTSEVQAVFSTGPQSQYIYNEDTGEYKALHPQKKRVITPWEVILSLAIAAGAGGLSCMSVVSRYKMKDTQKQAANSLRAYQGISAFQYQPGGGERLMNQFVTSTLIPRPPRNSGGGGGRTGGGTTTHIGSGGRSFSGGGRKF